MTTTSERPFAALSGANICRIVGFTCLAGYLFDMLTLLFPIGSGSIWRVNLLLQVGDRSIILLFGLALIIYGFWADRSWRKWMAYASMSIGVLFILSSILIIRDTLLLRGQAVDNIGRQASELQAQVEQSQSDPEIAAQVSPEDLANASRQIDAQAETLKQNATTTLNKSSISSISNFIIVGIGLIGLGRFGLTPPK